MARVHLQKLIAVGIFHNGNKKGADEMKHKFCAVAIAVCMIALTVNAFAQYSQASNITELPPGWEQSCKNNAAIIFEEHTDIAENSKQTMLLRCDDNAVKGTSNVSVTTSSYRPGNVFVVSLVSAVNESVANVNKRLRLRDSRGTWTNLLSMVQRRLTVFNKTTETLDIETDKFFKIDLAVDTDNDKAVLWIDGEKVGEYTETGITSEMASDFKLNMYNGYSAKKTVSEWYISDISVASSGAYNVKSIPENNSKSLDANSISDIKIDFGAVITDECFSSDKVHLIKGENEEISDISIDKQGSKVVVTPIEGFSENETYILKIDSLTDVFGIDHGEYELAFTTADSNYVAPMVSITSPTDGATYPIGKEISVLTSVTQGSRPVTKTVLYVNDEETAICTSEPYEFKFTPKTGTSQTLSVRVYDESEAYVTSEPVTVNTFENIAPTVKISAGNGQLLQRGDTVSYEATDSDGAIDRIEAYINDELVYSGAEALGSFEIPATVGFGKANIFVIAYDEYGLVGSVSADCVVSYVNKKLYGEVDFSGYDGEDSYGGYTFAMQGESYYNEAGEIGGERCLILGSKYDAGQKPGGDCLTVLWKNGPGSSQFSIKTRVFIEDGNSHSYLFLRDSNGSVAFGDVSFSGGNVNYNNGSEHTYIGFGWFDVVYDLNYNDNSYSLTINGKPILTNFKCPKPMTDFTAVRYHMMNKSEKSDTRIGISNISMYQTASYPYFDSVEFPSGSDKRIIVKTGGVIDPNTFQFNFEDDACCELLCEGQKVAVEFVEYAYADDDTERTAPIGLQYNLKTPVESDCVYSAKAKYIAKNNTYDISYDFIAPSKPDFNIKNAAFEVKDGEITFKVEFDEAMKDTKDALFIITEYDEDGVMYNSVYGQASVNGIVGYESKPLKYNPSHSYTAVARDSWLTMKPLTSKRFDVVNK